MGESQFRHGEPEVVDYPADPPGEEYLSVEQVRRHEIFADSATKAREAGRREQYQSLMGDWQGGPGFATNTNVRAMVGSVQAIPWGSATHGGHTPGVPENLAKKRTAAPETKKVIKLLRQNKTVNEITEATTKTADAIRQIKHALDSGEFDLSWLKS